MIGGYDLGEREFFGVLRHTDVNINHKKNLSLKPPMGA